MLASAPGRLNLMGDHTDYAGGLALPIAISRHAAAAIGRGPEPGLAEIVAADLADSCRAPLEPTAAKRALPGLPAWAAYPLGVLVEAFVRANQSTTNARTDRVSSGGAPLGVRLAFSSSVPVGAGLSSSAAITLACQRAADAWLAPGDRQIITDARRAQHVEHAYAGVPCGLLDQLAILGARAAHAQRLDFADLSSTHVPLPEHARVLVIDSAIRRRNADGRYRALRDQCEQAAAMLGVEHLARAKEASLAQLPAELNPIARHTIRESARVDAVIAAFQRADLADAGSLFNASHASLLGVLGVSTPELDQIAAIAESAPSVLGVRLTGAGLGGCLVALADAASFEGNADDHARTIQSALHDHGFAKTRVWVEAASDSRGSIAGQLD